MVFAGGDRTTTYAKRAVGELKEGNANGWLGEMEAAQVAVLCSLRRPSRSFLQFFEGMGRGHAAVYVCVM
jgi:hypothetical protein